jgi:general secretion pathway protein D
MKARSWILAAALLAASALQSAAQMALDMRDASLRGFVQIVAEATGRSFILDPRVQGTVTVIAPEQVSEAAVYEIFLNVLELNRLTIVEGDEADRIVPIDIARELAPGEDRDALGGAFETRVLQVRNAPVTEIVEVIRPLLPAEAVLSAVPDAGLLILSDRQENFRRISRLVRRLDEPRQSTIETIRLTNGDAADMLQVVQALDITPAGASLSADPRANALVVSGPPEFRDRVRVVVGELDTPQRRTATRVVRLDYADAQQLEPVVRESFGATPRASGGGGDPGGPPGSGEVTIVAEPQQNALIISAPAERVDDITASIRSLDARPSQVLIEGVIFELSVEGFSDLSVQFGAVLDDAIVGGVEFTLNGRPTLSSLVGSVLSNNIAGLGDGATLGAVAASGSDRFAGFLTALTSETSTRLLSTPSILTLNNQEAEIVVAQNVPFVTGSFATVGDSAVPDQPFQTIQRQDVGLTLTVTPQITQDDTVRLAIAQEVSNLTSSAAAAGGEITSKRMLTTNVLVRDGHVIMLGGLLEDGSGSVGQKVPWLGDAPVIGALFRGRNASRNQRVLLVMLRPRILNTDGEAERATRQVARGARQASRLVQPGDDGRFPRVPDGGLPFDGMDLDAPFRGGFQDAVAERRLFPPLPPRLEFGSR